MGLRERKKRQTRRELQRQALRLVVEQGIERVTVEEIAAAANVSPRTFFNYFPSKEEAVLGEGPPIPEGETRAVFVSGGPTGELFEDLKICLVTPLDEYSPSLEEVHLRKQLLSGEPQLLPKFMAGFAAMERALAEAIAERIGDDPVNLRPQLLAAIGAAAMRFSMRRWVSGEHERSDLQTVLAETFSELKKEFTGT
ncbi:TetR family transcriptional regulator [Nocardiopsis ansamitocini]|uniref:TetR family transcriptional regulator n=2 Tax=Nocardiopsis ansamitocini TaxID=1670832 RepID=A0A9W6P6I8_9ACTN|nr:TetR family transcriptional regulator [Nocardiopsis ansamitocini]